MSASLVYLLLRQVLLHVDPTLDLTLDVHQRLTQPTA